MKRLKIAEQIIIVLIIALFVPLVVTAIIVTNVNQHAVRKELTYSARIIADGVYQTLIKNIEGKKQVIKNTANSLQYIYSVRNKQKLLNSIKNESNEIVKISLENINKKSFKSSDINILHKPQENNLIISYRMNDKKSIIEVIDLKELEKSILGSVNSEERQVYIIDNKNNLLMSLNGDSGKIKELIGFMPHNINSGYPELFGKIKNQPNVIIKVPELNWSIIVATPRHVTTYGIIKARYKIILAIGIAAFLIFLLCAGYTYSLYINIRQLFKGIQAVGIGNYSRKIRLLKNLFTPYETIYLANEFNKMAEKINDSYIELHEKNEKLKKMDEYKSNLIDTVSHELRTPLTSIKGYTSRLLRHDIQIDAETRKKSLKVIKQQADRLSRMVGDLLVIPDIESSLLRVLPEEVILKDVIETSILSTSKKDSKIFSFAIEENFPNIYADPDRVEQIIINLLENAVKYSLDDTEIKINVARDDEFAIIKVHNECSQISEEKAKTLFDKFTRVDDNLTRTTRGTGLGLFIVKGLVEAMDGTINLNTNNGFEVTFTLPFSCDQFKENETTIENESSQ